MDSPDARFSGIGGSRFYARGWAGIMLSANADDPNSI